MKVVINANFGGFSITLEAAQFMAARGNLRAKAEIEKYEWNKAHPDPKYPSLSDMWYGFGYVNGMEGGYPRDDPDLIAAVESLGKRAGLDLKIIEIPDGIEWEINEYDGWESVHEKHRSWS